MTYPIYKVLIWLHLYYREVTRTAVNLTLDTKVNLKRLTS